MGWRLLVEVVWMGVRLVADYALELSLQQIIHVPTNVLWRIAARHHEVDCCLFLLDSKNYLRLAEADSLAPMHDQYQPCIRTTHYSLMSQLGSQVGISMSGVQALSN